MTVFAAVIAALSFVAFLVALQVGPSCASSVGPWSAGVFFTSWLYLAWRDEKKAKR